MVFLDINKPFVIFDDCIPCLAHRAWGFENRCWFLRCRRWLVFVGTGDSYMCGMSFHRIIGEPNVVLFAPAISLT